MLFPEIDSGSHGAASVGDGEAMHTSDHVRLVDGPVLAQSVGLDVLIEQFVWVQFNVRTICRPPQ